MAGRKLVARDVSETGAAWEGVCVDASTRQFRRRRQRGATAGHPGGLVAAVAPNDHPAMRDLGLATACGYQVGISLEPLNPGMRAFTIVLRGASR